MDNSFLREHAARCRSLADKADEFTKRRLLNLAARYDDRLLSQTSRASRIIKLPANLPDAPSELHRTTQIASSQAGSLRVGPSPPIDDRPSLSRRCATEPLRRSWKVNSVSSAVSRSSPMVLMPSVSRAFRILDGSFTRFIGVLSGSSGGASKSFGSLDFFCSAKRRILIASVD